MDIVETTSETTSETPTSSEITDAVAATEETTTTKPVNPRSVKRVKQNFKPLEMTTEFDEEDQHLNEEDIEDDGDNDGVIDEEDGEYEESGDENEEDIAGEIINETDTDSTKIEKDAIKVKSFDYFDRVKKKIGVKHVEEIKDDEEEENEGDKVEEVENGGDIEGEEDDEEGDEGEEEADEGEEEGDDVEDEEAGDVDHPSSSKRQKMDTATPTKDDGGFSSEDELTLSLAATLTPEERSYLGLKLPGEFIIFLVTTYLLGT